MPIRKYRQFFYECMEGDEDLQYSQQRLFSTGCALTQRQRIHKIQAEEVNAVWPGTSSIVDRVTLEHAAQRRHGICDFAFDS